MVELGVVSFVLAVVAACLVLWIKAKGYGGVLIWGMGASIFMMILSMILIDDITYNKTLVVKALDNGTLLNLGEVEQTTSVFKNVLPTLIFSSGVIIFLVSFVVFMRLLFKKMGDDKKKRLRAEQEEEYGIAGTFEN